MYTSLGTLDMGVFYMTVDHSTMLGQMSSETLHMRTATELIYAREAMQRTVEEKLRAYQHAMDRSKQEQERTLRSLEKGEVCLLYENRGGKLKSKWAENYTGPFVVQENATVPRT